MSRHQTREAIGRTAILRASPPLPPLAGDRTFELPDVLYAITGGLYLGFVGVMAVGLAAPGLIVPLAICAVFIAMFFAVPAQWVRMRGDRQAASLDWQRFRRSGIATLTGHLSGGEAAVQMLVLPVLIFTWALVCVTIAALV